MRCSLRVRSTLLVAGAMCGLSSFARGLEAGVLAGRGPAESVSSAVAPFLMGWTAEVATPPGLFEAARETGGVAVDPRTGWVYVGTAEGRVLCLDAGKVRWDVDAAGPVRAAPALFEEQLVVGTGEGVLVRINKVTGAFLGRAVLGEELVTTPVVVRGVDETVRVFVGSSGESVFAVDLELGQKLWKAHRDAPTPFSAHGFATPVVTEDRVFAAFADGWVEARELTTGKQLWEQRLSPRDDLVDVDALAWDGVRLFAASSAGGVFALDPSHGGTLWRGELRGAGRLQVDGARLYAVAPGLVRAFRTGDGAKLWSYATGERMGQTPVVLGDAVLVAEDDGPLRFLSPQTGLLLGQLPVSAASSPAVDGRLAYLLSTSGRVYSLAGAR
jgi:outer membrane protein assembly factor BamB